MKIKNVYLWQLMLSLVICSLILVLCSSLIVGYYVNKQQLITTSLETNYNYAKKLANTTDYYLTKLVAAYGRGSSGIYE